MCVYVGYAPSLQTSCDSLVVELSVAIAQTRVQFPVTAFLPHLSHPQKTNKKCPFLSSSSPCFARQTPRGSFPVESGIIRKLAMERAHSQGAISVQQQVPPSGCKPFQGVSSASSIIIGEDFWLDLEERVLGWLYSRGVRPGDPEALLQSSSDRFKRSISLRTCSLVNFKPTLSKRVKRLSQLHINLDTTPAGPSPRMTDSC